MSNELALLVILLVWLKTGRGINPCLLIAVYYVLYEISQSLTVNLTQIYFTSQIIIDITILFSCLLLAYKNIKQSFIILLYGLVVFSSLAVEGLRLVDEVSSSYVLIDLYDLRQDALDLIFAVLGSGRGELINDISLSIRGSRVYNWVINLKTTIQSYKL